MGRGRTKRGVIFFCVYLKLMYQTKVEVDHSVESWFVGMHSQEYLSQGAELLFHTLFSNRE